MTPDPPKDESELAELEALFFRPDTRRDHLPLDKRLHDIASRAAARLEGGP